jgi:hypothetical protein
VSSRYVDAAVRDELARLASTGAGARALATFKAAATLGGFASAGALDPRDAFDNLLAAAIATGLSEREAASHIARGLKRGAQTPRSIPASVAFTHSAPPQAAHSGELRYPATRAVEAVWSEARDVTRDADASGWLLGRGIDPAAVELWGLARAIPRNGSLPQWAASRQGSWIESSHRLVFRLFDASGRLRSLRARCLEPRDDAPKSIAPAGFTTRGLVLADPLGAEILAGRTPPWWTPAVLFEEGEPDFLTRASMQVEENEQGPAVYGIESGAWSRALADRIPDGARVVIETHHDEAGDRYAACIAESFGARCSLYRSPKRDVR